MWQMRSMDYVTCEPKGDWQATTEAFFWRNMGGRWMRNGYTKQEIVDWYKSHSAQTFKAAFKEFRWKEESND